MRDDATELAQGLERDLEKILDRYWSGWMKVGPKALLTPKIKPKQKKPTSSFTVNLNGTKRGQWYRFSQSVGGGAIALLYYGEHGNVPDSKSEWSEAFKLAREFLGIREQRTYSQEQQDERDRRREQEQRDRDERRRKDEEEQARKDAERTYSAQEVWVACKPLAGTHGEAYLVGRGIPPVSEWPWDCSDTIRFHPNLDFEHDRRVRLPAVVGAVRDAFGDVIAVWQIYLKRDEPVKADLHPSPKIGRGPAAGGAIRIGGDGERIGASEGMETALALWVLEGFRKPIWSMMSTSGMVGFEPPMFVKHVSIYPDGDKGQINQHNGKVMEPPGIKAARTLFGRMKDAGIGANINEMTDLGDGLDLLQTRNKHERPAQKKSGRQPDQS
jgi:hypothetical protein